MGGVNLLPTFFIGGAAKCGSFTLYHYLNQHPNILMSKCKEPGYFDDVHKNDINWYREQFNNWNGEKEIGEATVEYMVDENSPKRIKKLLPNSKFIFILRNPYERANSHYWHRIKQGDIDATKSFEEIILEGENSFPIKYSLYWTHLKRFLEFFPKNQIKILILEDLTKNRDEVFREIFNFLSVDEKFKVDYKGHKNKAKIQRSFLLDELLKHTKFKFIKVKDYIPVFLKQKLLKIYNLVDNANKKEFSKPALSNENIYELSKYFTNEINGIEAFLERDLKEWKKYNGRKIKNILVNI